MRAIQKIQWAAWRVQCMSRARWQRFQGRIARFYFLRVTLPLRLWHAAGCVPEWQPRIPWWQPFVWRYLVLSGAFGPIHPWAYRMLTDQWRTEASKRFPDLADRFQEADTPYLVWFELTDAFKQAYRSPRNEDLIKRVYDYCYWCIDQPAGTTAEDDLATCVSVCFFEHIPQVSEAVEDMPRWFSRADVLRMKEVFSYLVGAEGYAKVLARFDRHPNKKGK